MEVGDAVLRGDRRVVLIGGEAGVGKSRTVAELIPWLRERRCRVIVGRCLEFGEQIWPFAALRELLACLVDELDEDQLRFAFGASAGLFRSLVPELGDVTIPPAPAIDPDRLCEAVVGVLRRLAHWGPLAVVMEDLHWADASTQSLFSLLARSSRPPCLLLVGTYRNDDSSLPQPIATILADVARAARPDVIDLRPFDRPETGRLVHALSDADLAEASIETIHRLSGGNAFYVEELVAAGGNVNSSSTLRHVVLARTVGCSAEERHALNLVAVGGRVPLELLRSETEDAVIAVLDRGLVMVDGTDVRYRHELARAVIEADVSVADRSELHRLIAAGLEQFEWDRLGEIARHWAEGQRPDRAIGAWVHAARAAMRAGMPSEATAQLQLALASWTALDAPESAVGCELADLLMDAANAAYQARQLAEAIELTRRAIHEVAGRDPWREGRAWLALRNMCRFSNRWEECAEAVSHALEVIPASPPSLERVEVLADAALGHCYVDHALEANRLADEAVQVAQLVGTAEARVIARYAVASARAMTTTDLDGLLRYEFETYSMCDETMSPERRLFALNSLTNTLVRVGRLAELIDIAAAAVDLVRTTGLGGPLGAAMAEYWVGCLVSLGRWSEAEQVYDDVRDLIEQTRGDQPFYYFDLALIRQGRLEAARDHIEVLRRWLATPGYWDETLEELAAAVLEFDALDRPDDVDVVGLVDDARKKGSAGQRLGEWMLLAEAIGVLADRSRDPCGDSALVADWLRDAARDPKELVGEHALMKRRAIIEADRLAGRPRPEAWRDLAIDSADLGLRYDEAYAWFRAGEAGLCGVGGRGAGSKREARCALRHACVTAERLGAEPLLRRIHALARSARLDLTKEPAEPAPVSPLTELGLTGREADVLQLVAAGMSNGAIGARLFISRKAASVHVSNILRKLGVSNRIEAAGILHRISLDRDGAASADRFDP